MLLIGSPLRCVTLFAAALLVVSGGCRSLTFAPTPSLVSSLRSEQPRATPEQPIKQGPLTQQESAAACFALAENLEAAGHTKEAIAQYEQSRKLAPQQPEIARRLAVLYDLSSQPAKARREFNRALEAGEPDAELLTDYGYFLLRAGDLEDAETALRDVLRTSPGQERASTNLGILLARQGRYDEALEIFQTVVGKAAAYSNIGVVMLQQGAYADAERAFQRALQINPQFVQARTLLRECEVRSSPGATPRREAVQ